MCGREKFMPTFTYFCNDLVNSKIEVVQVTLVVLKTYFSNYKCSVCDSSL